MFTEGHHLALTFELQLLHKVDFFTLHRKVLFSKVLCVFVPEICLLSNSEFYTVLEPSGLQVPLIHLMAVSCNRAMMCYESITVCFTSVWASISRGKRQAISADAFSEMEQEDLVDIVGL